jgi:DNA polymerase III sliding clamp (beta) subunit (PCNA family)
MVKIKCSAAMAKTMLKAASAVSDEVLFKFGKDGVEVRQMDPAMISMVAVSIPKAKFMEYSIEGEEELLMVDVKDLLLAVSKATEIVSIERIENRFAIRDVSLGSTRTLFTSIIESSGKALSRMPTLTSDAKVVLKTSELEKAVKYVQAFSHSKQIAFSLNEGGNFRVSGIGDKNEAVMDLDRDNKKTIISVEGKLPDKVLYSAQYIIDLLGAIDSDTVKLEMKVNTPLIMRDMELDIQTLLAPHVSREG